MSATTRIQPAQLAEYFDGFTKRFLRDGPAEAVDVEAAGPDLGVQYIVDGVRLLGITYDADTNTLEIAFDSGDHRVFRPAEVWAIEAPNGFPSALEIVSPNGLRELIRIRPVGLQRMQ
jgi:hypothetical protein